MRTLLLLGIIAGSLAVPTLAASQPAPQGQLQTTDQTTKSTVGDAASAPMHDLNVMRSKIPPVLLAALADPYGRPAPANCPSIIAKVRELTTALGDDLDVPDDDGDPTMRQKSAGLGRELVRAGAESLIPLRGFVRKLSGAEQHDRLVQSALTAGNVRRGYLKGLGEARGCSPPGTPRHLVQAAYRAEEDGPRKPNYPIR
jgi:hypothetical protein